MLGMNVHMFIRKYMGFSPAAGAGHAGDPVRVGVGLSPAAMGDAGVGHFGGRGTHESLAGMCKEKFQKRAWICARNWLVRFLTRINWVWAPSHRLNSPTSPGWTENWRHIERGVRRGKWTRIRGAHNHDGWVEWEDIVWWPWWARSGQLKRRNKQVSRLIIWSY
jgi:hypothetical protein